MLSSYGKTGMMNLPREVCKMLENGALGMLKNNARKEDCGTIGDWTLLLTYQMLPGAGRAELNLSELEWSQR